MNTDNAPFVVVCIDDTAVNTLIQKGETYNVVGEELGCYILAEILINPYTGNKAGFDKSRFAPIQEQYADIRQELVNLHPNINEGPDKVLSPEKILN